MSITDAYYLLIILRRKNNQTCYLSNTVTLSVPWLGLVINVSVR